MKSVCRSGNELELGLGAGFPALAEDAAGADGDGGLDDVEALAQRILLRIEQRQDAIALVVVQQVPGQRRRGDGRRRPCRS
jgi:hypothetical protein